MLSDEWLGGIIGYPVYRVEGMGEGGAVECSLARHIAARQSRTMYYAKVDTRDIATVRDLMAAGLYVVDVNVTLGIQGGVVPPETARSVTPDVTVDDCDPAAAPGALAIAGSAIRYSRFHLDPDIPTDVAHRIKHEWIQNYVRGVRGEALLVARVGDRIAGFLAVLSWEKDGRRVRAIDLIAVDPAHRRRGVGRALVGAFVQRYATTSDLLQVGTQVANAESLRLYQRLGFVIRQAVYVLHLHTPASPAATA